MPGETQKRSFVERHGITWAVALRVSIVVALLMAVGVRFERTIVALACSVGFLIVFFFVNRSPD